MLLRWMKATFYILLFLDASTSSNTTNRDDTGHNDSCSHQNVTEKCGDTKSHLLNEQKTLAFYYITIVLTLLAYALVLPPAYRKKQPSSVFIFSLAIADSFIAFVIVPIKISEVYGSTWQKNIVFCRIGNSITLFGIGLASTNVLVVSIDRALYFALPLKYRSNVTNKRAVIACIVAFLLALPAFFPVIGIGGLSADQELPFCAFKFSFSRTYMWCSGIVYVLVPAVIIVALQLDIIRRTKAYYQQHRDFIKQNPQNKQKEKQIKLSMKREMRIQRMFLIITLMFFVCWGPFIVGTICNLVATHLITPFFIQLMRVMLFVNSFVNPTIIFLTTNDVFKYLRCCCLGNKRSARAYSMKTSSTRTASTNKGFAGDSSFDTYSTSTSLGRT